MANLVSIRENGLSRRWFKTFNQFRRKSFNSFLLITFLRPLSERTYKKVDDPARIRRMLKSLTT